MLSIVTCAFTFVFLVFLVYDLLVYSRNEKMVTAAAGTSAVVSALFPEQMREKIVGAYQVRANEQCKTSRTASVENSRQQPETQPECDVFSEQIADQFLESSIMFADIAGFTAWSSLREPKQVFLLLESVYAAFDDIARARRVFKVETIGDCYVAATGLPVRRSDHAIVMCRFARDILRRMKEVVQGLEVALGPGTASLELRIGINSGPVTAGVLRGDKARYQLFGDTMNTASRMESNGIPGKIHLSEDTANELIRYKKQHWIQKRSDMISAKGKGDMQTYWLVGSDRAISGDSSSLHSSTSIGEVSNQSEQESRDSVLGTNAAAQALAADAKTQRLIDWNVESLLHLLRKVVIHRRSSTESNVCSSRMTRTNSPFLRASPSAVQLQYVDLLKESIDFPAPKQRNDSSGDGQVEDDESLLPKTVVEQLHRYVCCLEEMHHNLNPFHNFEHTSHVCMSVLKLLSRLENLAQDNTASDAAKTLVADPISLLATAMAALIHAVDYNLNERIHLSQAFHNRAVPQQNALSLALTLWHDDESFAELRSVVHATPEEYQRFWQVVTHGVLATDLYDEALHHWRDGRWKKAQKLLLLADNAEQHPDQPNPRTNLHATLLVESLLQASYVSHSMQHWQVFQKWNERLYLEKQISSRSDAGSRPVMGSYYSWQMDWLDVKVIPLAVRLKSCGMFGSAGEEYFDYADRNRRHWELQGRELEHSLIQKAEAIAL